MDNYAFDGRMIGPCGNIVTYPRWFFAVLINTQKRLNRIARETGCSAVLIIKRDRQSGFRRVLPEIYRQLGALLEAPHFNPCRRLRSGWSEGRTAGRGPIGLMGLLECGIDPACGIIRRCEADLEESRRSALLVDALIDDIRKRKRNGRQAGKNKRAQAHGSPALQAPRRNRQARP